MFCALVTARAHTLFNFRSTCRNHKDRRRRERAQVPADVTFATKTEQGTEMVTSAVTGGVPFSWAAGDEMNGRSSKLRAACEDVGKGYLFAVPVSFTVTTPAGRKPAAAVAIRVTVPEARRLLTRLALPAHRQATPSSTPGASGDEAIRHAPDGTITRRNFGPPQPSQQDHRAAASGEENPDCSTRREHPG